MALELTYDYHLPAVQEPGFARRYDSQEIVRSLNAVTDSVSNRLFWKDRATSTLMLKPQQVEKAWLNSALQLPYLIRLADMQANPTNISSQLVIEKAYLQNSDNPWIFHGPISPTSGVSFVNSPEQVPGQVDLENHAAQPGSITTFPTAAPLRDEAGRFAPTVAATDMKVIVWSKVDIPWNMPLYLRWWIGPEDAGHQSLYDFNVGQFCVRVGASAVEVFRDTSAAHDRTSWVKTFAAEMFSPGPVQTIDYYGNVFPGMVSEQNGEARSLLWLPYRRNYVYLESSKGKWGVFQANSTPRGNGLTGTQSDWAIVEPRKLIVAGLTPGPGWFQVQKLAFPVSAATFNLPPFRTDYAPAGAPANNWLRDAKDTPQGSTISHSTPTAAVVYSFKTNTIDDECPSATTTSDASDQSRTFQSQYTFTSGTDPTNGALHTYTPMLYGIDVQIGGTTRTWPVTATSIKDVSLAAPSARIKSATFSVDVKSPGRFEAQVEDLSKSISALYGRFYYPLQFADDNNDLNPANWTTLWVGIADPQEVRELRLDLPAPREIRTAGTDFWKWLTDSPMRDTRDFSGVGHITTIQQVVQLAGISIAGWDGPSPGTYNSGTGQFTIDPFGWDTPLGGLNLSDPGSNTGDSFPNQQEPLHPTWRPSISPPDNYATYIRRIADLFAGWDLFFNANGTIGYMPYDYYTASEVTFFEDSQAHPAGPLYYRPSVEFRAIEPDANVVQGVTGNHAGSRQYSSLFVDFPSINTSTAVNFIGKPKFLLFSLPGWTPCVDLNKCARAVHTRARQRHQIVNFHGTYVPTLRLGHVFTLSGETGTYRLLSVRASYDRPNWNTAHYSGRLVERGYD
jgi:hypothetical protein